MLKRLYLVLFVIILISILMKKSIILESRTNFYSFVICLAAVLAHVYFESNTIFEPFEESKQGLVQSKPAPEPETSDRKESDMIPFDDTFHHKFNKNLAIYFSTLDPKFIDSDRNLLLNKVPISGKTQEENALQIPADTTYLIDQKGGLLVNFKKPLRTVYPREISFNSQEFTICWYAKFIPTKYDDDVITKNVYLINIPVHDQKNVVGIEYEFSSNYTNPSIQIHWKGKKLEGARYQFQNTSNDDDKNRNFFDNNFHLFTLIKKNDNELKLILDDQTVTNAPLISSQILDTENPVVSEKNSYQITLNSSVNDPTTGDDTLVGKSPNVALNCHLVAFALFNRAVDITEVNLMYDYFQDCQFHLDKRYQTIKSEVDSIKTDVLCPFSDKSLCDVPNCSSVTNWNNFGSVLKNNACAKDIIQYCKSLDSIENDAQCSFYNQDNLEKASSLIQDITPAEDISPETEEEILVKQLRKIGLNDIHLDKSLRAKGKYSDEINQLIDKIYEQKQLNLKNIASMHELDDNASLHKPLNYNELINNSNVDINSNVEEKKTNKKDDLVKLDFKELSDFDDIMAEYNDKEEKSNEKTGFLSRWF